MKSATVDLIANKLKNAPQSVVQRVLGYIDALVEPDTNAKPYNLSETQQKILDSQLNADTTTYTDAEKLYKDLKNKYDL